MTGNGETRKKPTTTASATGAPNDLKGFLELARAECEAALCNLSFTVGTQEYYRPILGLVLFPVRSASGAEAAVEAHLGGCGTSF